MENYTYNIELPEIALKLRQLRIKKGLAIEELAGLSGINSLDLLNFELGKALPSKFKVKKLLKILN